MLALGSVTSSVACAKVNEIKAKKAFKSANQAYQAADYKKASDLYEETVAADPNLNSAYFFLGNSYDNQYKPSKKGEEANDALLTKAVDNYQKAAEKLSASDKADDKKLGTLSLQYLVAAYGPDKLNDPAKAEPVVQKMIQLEPNEPSNYFALAKIYEDAGAYDEAEKVLQQAKAARPTDPAVYMTLAGYYNRQGHFDKTIEALEERAERAEQPRGVLHDRHLLLGRGVPRLQAEGSREARVRRQGRRSGGSRPADQARLHGGARLQEPAPPAAGEPRKGSRETAAADQGRRQAPRQGTRAAETEGGRRQLARTARQRPSLQRVGSKAVRAT
jgi:tetratricopeptide (TPR) repeat protein